jgi:hypothetical protein
MDCELHVVGVTRNDRRYSRKLPSLRRHEPDQVPRVHLSTLQDAPRAGWQCKSRQRCEGHTNLNYFSVVNPKLVKKLAPMTSTLVDGVTQIPAPPPDKFCSEYGSDGILDEEPEIQPNLENI